MTVNLTSSESNGFVGVSNSLLDEETLQKLLSQQSPPSAWFLRFCHKTSWQANDFPSPEGQVFNATREFRWKCKPGGYEVLLLSIDGKDSGLDEVTFDSMQSTVPDHCQESCQWLCQVRDAYFYPDTETRFPNPMIYPNVDIAQRYFIDRATSTVHFVALTLK